MPLTINSNPAAVTASHNLSRNNASLQKSLARLSSGSRINKPSDDAGGLAVSMKLNASASRLRGVNSNIQNAISFLEVQDGVLQGSADILTRMGELKSLSQDMTKNSSDIANYNAEFQNLQVQLYQIAQESFNGVSLFATTTTSTGATSAIFGGGALLDNTVDVYTTERGTAGSVVSLNKATLLSAVTFDTNNATATSRLNEIAWALNNSGAGRASGSTGAWSSDHSFAAEDATQTISLGVLSVSFFTAALENLATLRAQNGGTSSRLQFALEQANRAEATIESANGRIVDVDVAEESTRLAKYNILVQASTAMLAQANVAPNSALMLLG